MKGYVILYIWRGKCLRTEWKDSRWSQKKSQSKMLQKRQAFQLQLYPERLMAWVELGRKPEIMYWKSANAWPMYPVHSPADWRCVIQERWGLWCRILPVRFMHSWWCFLPARHSSMVIRCFSAIVFGIMKQRWNISSFWSVIRWRGSCFILWEIWAPKICISICGTFRSFH